MEEQYQERPFDPYYRFGMKSSLSKVAPELYTEEQLTQLKEIEEEIMNYKKRHHSSDEGSTSERRAKPQKKKKEQNQPPPSLPPELPIHVRNMISTLNGTDIRYVMCKKLFATDLSKGHNRLSLPGGQIILTQTEKEISDSRDENDKPIGFEVVVLDPSFRRYIMVLKKWNMSSGILNLMKRWNDLLKKNKWTTNNKLDIWSFRVNDQLHFTLNNKES